MASVKPMLAMLGPAPASRGGLAGMLAAYREQGLFRRWPIEYLATHADGGPRRNAVLALAAMHRFAALLARERALAVHLHVSTEQGLWRDVPFMALAMSARCPVILQLHGTGLRRLHDHGGRATRLPIQFFLEQAACVIVPCEWQRGWVRAVARRAQVAVVPVPIAPGATLPASTTPPSVGGGVAGSGVRAAGATSGGAAGFTGCVGITFGGGGFGASGIFGAGAISSISLELTVGVSARTPSTSNTASPSACSATDITTVPRRFVFFVFGASV